MVMHSDMGIARLKLWNKFPSADIVLAEIELLDKDYVERCRRQQHGPDCVKVLKLGATA